MRLWIVNFSAGLIISKDDVWAHTVTRHAAVLPVAMDCVTLRNSRPPHPAVGSSSGRSIGRP